MSCEWSAISVPLLDNQLTSQCLLYASLSSSLSLVLIVRGYKEMSFCTSNGTLVRKPPEMWDCAGWFENAVHQNAGSAVQSSALLSRCPRARRRTPKWPALPCKCSSGVWMGDWKATLWIALGTVSADRSPSYRERNQTMLRKHAIWFQGCLLLSRFSKHRNIV